MRSNSPTTTKSLSVNFLLPRLFKAGRIGYDSWGWLTLMLLLVLSSCVQHTFDPTQTNSHIIRIETVKSTGAVAKNVQLSLFDDNTPESSVLFIGNTGDSGAVNIHLDIPTFGHNYSLRVRKDDPLGQLLYARTIWPLTLKCVDTTIIIVVPEVDTSHPADSLCTGKDISRTLTFFACADTSVSQGYDLTNCTAAPYMVTAGTLGAPFSIDPKTATIAAGATQRFTITYDGRGQTADASARVTLTTAPASGNAILTLIGHLRHDCNITTQNIICGQNNTADSIRFGTICPGQPAGPECVSFVNSNSVPVTVSFPTAPTPFTYTVSDNNGAAVDPGSPLTVKKGESFTVCVSVTPTTIGALQASIILQMQCLGGTNFTYAVPISATVKICNTCTCTDYFHAPIKISTNIQVGKDTTITAEFFHNDLSCPVSISNASIIPANSEWSIVSITPPLPTTVAAGGNLTATLHFKPTKAGVTDDHFQFNMTPAGATAPCFGDVELIATGCNAACATLTMPLEWQPSPKPNGPDTLFFTQSSSPAIFVSTTGNNSISDAKCITIKYTDTACSAKQITIIPPKSSMWTLRSAPSPLTLNPGGTAQICVTFTAPSITQVRKDFTQPNQELKYTDVMTIIDPDGCNKIVPLKAVVDTLPLCKEFDLAQYDFVGAGQVVYRESYLFDNGRQDNVTPASPGIPTFGDMYLKTPTIFSNTTNAAPPGFFHWKNSNVPICNNIPAVTASLSAQNPSNQFYVTSLAFAQYDWIVVKVHPGTYAVIQVTATYIDGFNIPHAVCSVLYPFYY